MYNEFTYEYEFDENIENFFDNSDTMKNLEKKYPCALDVTNKFLYVDYLNSFSSKDVVKKYSNNHDCQTSALTTHGGFLDFFVRDLPKYCTNLSKIEFIKIGYVDRGVMCFRTFANMLKDLFPNLKRLCIQQNWTFHNLKTDEDIANDYLYMLQILQLEKFMIISEQDVFFNYFSLEEISNVMKANSIYICINKQSTEEMFDDVENNKKIIVYKKYEIDHCL
jgi:hypothetical protein